MSLVSKQDVYDATLTLLTKDVEGNHERLLWEIVQWEKLNTPKTDELREYWGFEWHHVHGDVRTLNSYVTRRVLNVVYKTNKASVFRTIDREAIEKALDDYRGSMISKEEETKIPPDLFDIIVGHESKKELIQRCLSSPRPVSCLLYGSPSSAKTLMLEELSRLPNSHFVLGSNLRKAGLFEVLFSERPTYLILDELDKIDDPRNLAALLSLMERGLVTETKYRRHKMIRLKTWVFASANEIYKIPRELMSRFLKLKFKDYTHDEFTDVVVTVLRTREGTSESLALYISQSVMRELDSKDVRDAIRVARLLKEKTRQEVDYLVGILKKQK